MRISLIVLLLVGSFKVGAIDLQKMREKKAPVAEAEKTRVDTKKPHSFFVGFDLFSKSILKTSSQSNGAKDYFSPLQYPFVFIYSYRFDERNRLLPEIDYTIFYKKGEDGGTEETDFLAHLPYAHSIGYSNFEWKVGLIFHQNRIIGHGGTVTLNNGSAATDYYLPSDTILSNSFKSEIGVVYEIENIQIQGNVILEAPFNSAKRNYSVLAGLVYKIGGF